MQPECLYLFAVNTIKMMIYASLTYLNAFNKMAFFASYHDVFKYFFISICIGYGDEGKPSKFK